MAKPESKKKRQVRWDEAAKRVDQIGDKLGMPIDKGIKKAVIAFHILGIESSGSCEGHLNRPGTEGPWIDIDAEGTYELLDKIDKETPSGKDEDKWQERLRREVEPQNLEARKKALELLGQFYTGREEIPPIDRRIIISGVGWGGRIHPQGASLLKIEPDETTRKQKLAEYQQEMRQFSGFLKRKYFEK